MSSYGDNKHLRARVDVRRAQRASSQNLYYNKDTKKWENKTPESVVLLFYVRTVPRSYKPKDNLPFHIYPVYFEIEEPDKLWDSKFKWRTGSFYPIPKYKKSVSPQQKQRQQTILIKKGVQIQFAYEMMFLLYMKNMLFGTYTLPIKSLPRKTNPRKMIYFDKHAYYIVLRVLPRYLTSRIAFEKKMEQG
jgi:hypothetical protein